MRMLLDTHALLWWAEGSRRLSLAARTAIADDDNEVLVSAASAWEIATKARLGKLTPGPVLAANVGAYVRSQSFTTLDVTFAHAQRAGAMPGSHRDPFDRLLVAQALVDGLLLVSADDQLDAFGVERLW